MTCCDVGQLLLSWCFILFLLDAQRCTEGNNNSKLDLWCSGMLDVFALHDSPVKEEEEEKSAVVGRREVGAEPLTSC